MGKLTETYETAGPRCPYCQHLHRPDGPFWFDEMLCDADCDGCGRNFDVRVYTSTSWTCSPAGESQ